MKFICSTFGSSGDVFPVLGLALELRRRGHEVIFATNEHYGPVACKHGLPFEALGDEQLFAACINNPDLWHPQRALGHILRTLAGVPKRQYEIHAQHAARGPVVGITNIFGFGAYLAQEKLGVPVITVHCQPAVIWSDHDPPLLPGLVGPRWLKSLCYRLGERLVIDRIVGSYLNPWRGELGLRPLSRVTRWWHSPYGVVCLFPDWFSAPQADWPANLVQTDFPLWNHREGDGLPAEVAQFLEQGDTPLVFTPGSANIHGHAFFRAAVDACRRLGRRGILLTEFPQQVPHPLPETVAHFSYVPLDWLLPRAAAFVHHGGIGSTSQALSAGIPQLIMPLAHDQFDNAARVRRMGVGSSLLPRRFTGPRVASQLRRLLDSPDVEAACRQIAQRLTQRDGLQRAAGAIEQRVAQTFAQAG